MSYLWLTKERSDMMTDYEMLFLQAKEKQYRAWLDNQRYYEVFELPFILQTIKNKIEVCLDTSNELSDMRTTESDVK